MWQMRNEELEQRLAEWMLKCWNLKQVVLEQQKLIIACKIERQDY